MNRSRDDANTLETVNVSLNLQIDCIPDLDFHVDATTIFFHRNREIFTQRNEEPR